MAGERVITLRFKEENLVDMELYYSLEQEKKELGLSTPVYVKDILRRHVESVPKEESMNIEIDNCLERIQDMVHEELASFRNTITEMLTRMTKPVFDSTKEAVDRGRIIEKEELLPEYCEELPEGLDSILEQFL